MPFKRIIFGHNKTVVVGVNSLTDFVTREDDLIPKPRGEVGRLSRGGYNLQSALGWTDSLYSKVLVSETRSSRFQI